MKRILASILVILIFVGAIPSAAQSVDGFDLEKEALLSALYEADIATLREAIDLRLISCEELTAYYLERIEAYNKPYNCFITLCDDALAVARQRDEALASGEASGTLFGIPIVIKDNMDLAGFHTTNGYKKKASQIADDNAQVVDYLLSEGAVIIAKANMSTGAQSARDSISQVAGQTKNAYSRYMSSAGSSGGSAVSTSLNFAVASLGTDTNSSLRLPAAYNGCVTIRPTFGLVSVDGVVKLNSSRDTPGAITRTVYDQAIMLDVITGGQYNYTENLNNNALEGLRIGVWKELSYAVSGHSTRKQSNLDPEITAAFENALEDLRQCGVEIVTVSMPKIFKLSDATFDTNASAPKEKLYAAFQAMLEEYDVCAVVFPTYLSTPLRSGKDADGKSWSVWDQQNVSNCGVLSPSAGVPEMTLPIGLHSLGCGIGLEIATLKNNEQLLLDIGYSYTSRYDHRALPEGAPDTYSQHNTGSLQEIIDAYKLFLNPPPPPTTVPAPTTQVTVPTTQPVPPTTLAPQPTTAGSTKPATQTATQTASPTLPTPAEPEPEPVYRLWQIPLGAAVVILVSGSIYQKIKNRKQKVYTTCE